MALSKFLSVVLSAFFFFDLAVAQTIAAWHNGVASQVIVQDPDTGDVYYCNCNSQNTPVFPTNPKNVFPFTQPPKLGSSLAGIGYYSGTTIVAGIWYTDELDKIWQVLAQCETSEANFTITGTYLTSQNLTTGINNSTGLAALVLSGSAGYRVFYHNTSGYLHQFGYQVETGWTDGIPISPDLPAGFSVSAVAKDPGNYTVIMPLDDEAIEAATYRVNNTFNISTLPYPLTNLAATSDDTQPNTVNTSVAIGDNSLPYWSAAHAHLGVSMNPSDQSRQVFYIDTTSRLQQYNCNSISCTLLQPQESSIWPVADQPNAPIGITNALDTTEIFYYSNGSLIVVELDSENNWQPASVLPTTATKSTGPTAAKSTGTAVTNATGTAVTSATKLGSSTTSAIPTSQPSNGLSAGNAAEIAAGILGGVALVVGIIFFFWRRKRQGGWFQYPKSAWLLPAEVTDTQRHEMDGKMKNKLELQASMRSEME